MTMKPMASTLGRMTTALGPSVTSTVARRTLLGLLYFGVVSCLIGAVMGVALNGGPIPIAFLSGTPFDSYLVPGLILGLVVGGTQLVAAIMFQRRRAASLVWCVVAGFGMMIWIFLEIAIIKQYSFLQSIYFGLGVAELILVLALLGIAPRLVAPWMSSGDRVSGTVEG
jgi:hypothetical protein